MTQKSSVVQQEDKNWSKYAQEYDPIRCGSIDGTDTQPHDRGIVRAIHSNYKLSPKVSGDPKSTIFIGRLHMKTDEKTLTSTFEKFGKVKQCRVVRDLVTGFSKCYGFIEFEKHYSAEDAIKQMQGAYIDDCEVVVEHECERILKGWKPRRLGGGFGGRKESGQLRFGCRTRPFQRPLQINDVTDIKEILRHKKYTRKKQF